MQSEDPKDLFAKIGSFFRAQRQELLSAYVTDLVAFLVSGLVLRLSRWPSHGELVTETARFQATVQRFDEASRAAFNRAYAEERALFLRSFWGTRRALIPPELLPLWEPVANATTADVQEYQRPFVTTTIDRKLCDALLMRDDQASKDLWRAADEADRSEFEPRKLKAFGAALRDLLARTTDLPAPVRTDIEGGLQKSEHAMTVAVRATGQWQSTCTKLVGLPAFGFDRSSYRMQPAPENYLGGMDRDRYDLLVKAFVQNPEVDLRLQTRLEEEVERAMWNTRAWHEGRLATGASEEGGVRTLFFLQNAVINDLREEWDAVELLRLFDGLGVDPAAPALRVVERTGPIQGRPAYWYAYPAGEGMSLLVALHLRPRDPLFDSVFLVRGTMEEALAWLAEHYNAREWKKNRLELDDAPSDIPRSVVDALQAQDAVASARGRQQEVRQFLAEYAEDQRQDH